jgi:site-specific DNA recombinase
MGQNRGLIHLVRWRGFQNFFSGSTKFSRKNVRCKDSILEDCRLMQTTLTDCTGIDAEIESLLEEIDVVTELTKRCIAENSQTAQNQEEYATRYNGFVERYEKAKAQLEQLRATKAEREAQADAIGAFTFEVQELDTITDFDKKLWLTLIDTVTVHADGRMTFKFQGGKTLTSY